MGERANTPVHAEVRVLAELIDFATRLNSSGSLENLLSSFSLSLGDIWGGAGIRVCAVDQDAGLLIPLHTYSAMNPIPMQGSLFGTVIRSGRCTLVPDLDRSAAYIRGREAPPGLLWQSAIVCPIPPCTRPSHVVGVFLPAGRSVGPADVTLLERAVSLLEPLLERWRSQEVQLEAFKAISHAIAAAVDARDPHLVGHGERVSEFAQATGRVHGLEPGFIDRLALAGLLHDVGRLGIPESILSKPGPLTPDEFRVIRAHSDLSVRFLEKVDYLSDVFSAIRHHHERFDGGGYPDGLEGEDIPLGARILAVADAFDAMTSPRPFRDAMSDADALRELHSQKGGQFDPILVESLARAYEEKMILSQNVLKADDPLASLRDFRKT